jgi:hypothetical protein
MTMKSLKRIFIVIIIGLAATFITKTASAQLYLIVGNAGLHYSWFNCPGADNIVVSEGAG